MRFNFGPLTLAFVSSQFVPSFVLSLVSLFKMDQEAKNEAFSLHDSLEEISDDDSLDYQFLCYTDSSSDEEEDPNHSCMYCEPGNK